MCYVQIPLEYILIDINNETPACHIEQWNSKTIHLLTNVGFNINSYITYDKVRSINKYFKGE